MTTELTRTWARKRIYLTPDGSPDDALWVDVPVSTNIQLKQDQQQQFWVRRIDVQNGKDDQGKFSLRKVHAVSVSPVAYDGVQQDNRSNTYYTTSDDKAADDQTIKVERLDEWPVKLGTDDQYWVRKTTFDNRTGEFSDPENLDGQLVLPHFTGHRKTHVVRCVNPNNDSIFIDLEFVDEFFVENGSQEQFWGHKYTLLENPTEGEDTASRPWTTHAASDPTKFVPYSIVVSDQLPEVSDNLGGTIDPPWRLDPFQNIVNFSSAYYVLVIWAWDDWGYEGTPSLRFTTPDPAHADTILEGASGHPVTNSLNIDMSADANGVIFDSLKLTQPGPFDVGSGPGSPAGVMGAYPRGDFDSIWEGGSDPDVGTPSEQFVPVYKPIEYSGGGFAWSSYSRTYVFSTSPADDVRLEYTMDHVTPSVARAEFGASYSYIAFSQGAITQTAQQVFGLTGGPSPRFDTYVFRRQDVVLYPDDPTFPIRKIGDDGGPTGTKFDAMNAYLTSTNDRIAFGQPVWGDSTDIFQTYTNSTYEFAFSSIEIDGIKYPFFYPLTPRAFHPPSFDPGVFVGRYLWAYRDTTAHVGGSSKFGDPPSA